jgi:hypothetical protein
METDVSLEIAWETLESADPPNRETRSYVDLRLSSQNPAARMERCALTADFLAGFLAPPPEATSLEREELSVVMDELLANAVKFSADLREPVSMTVHHYGDSIRVEASNVCGEQQAKALVETLRRVIDEKLEDLFVDAIEANAGEPDASRLGFITLRLNFGARLGARIRPDPETGQYRVTVAVVLDRPEAP